MYDVDPELFFSFVYLVAALCFIFPPKEVASAGLTIQNLFSGYLGSEDLSFIQYHIKRTSVTVLVHSLIPFVYLVGLKVYAGQALWLQNPVLIAFCVAAPLFGLFKFFSWKFNTHSYHPLVRVLSGHGTPWQNVASQINREFRSINKFSSVMGGTSLYVTDSWILKCTAYSVSVAQQTDSHLHVVKSEEHFYSHEQTGHQPAQYLQIKVKSVNRHVKPFDLSLNSSDYMDLKDRLSAPIVAARDIVIHQSLSDRFLEAFREQITENGYSDRVDGDLDSCIGCMVKPAAVKLEKRCAALDEGECMQCYCRPMWCLDCMGKWFASRQDQQAPETWLAGLSPCPTCRAKFCMLDIVMVRQ